MTFAILNALADVVASPGSWETTPLYLLDFIEGFQRTQVKAAAGPSKEVQLPGTRRQRKKKCKDQSTAYTTKPGNPSSAWELPQQIQR
jgi:hypothetical protein